MPTASSLERELVRHWYEARNQHDWSSIENSVHEHFVCENMMLGVVISGRSDYAQYCRDFDLAFSDAKFRIDRMISAPGGLFVVEVTVTGTQTGAFGVFPPSGQNVVMQFCDVLKVEGLRIASLRTYGDLYQPLVQMRHVILQEKSAAA